MPVDRPTPHVHLRGEESAGQVSVIETAPAPGAGPPLHHHDFDEAFYVIEGALTFRLRDETIVAGPGDLVSHLAGFRTHSRTWATAPRGS